MIVTLAFGGVVVIVISFVGVRVVVVGVVVMRHGGRTCS
jgi:hypothetical protein